MKPTQFHAGEDVVFRVIVYADQAKTQRKDLTGATVVYRLGLAKVGITSLESAGFVYDAEQGEIGVSLTDTQTAALASGQYDHQFIVTIGADTRVVLAERVRVLPMLQAVA